MNRRRRNIDDTFDNLLNSILNTNTNYDPLSNSLEVLFQSIINSSLTNENFRSSLMPLSREPRSGISRLVNPESFLCSKRYEDYQYEKAKEHYLTKIKINNQDNFISRAVLNIILDIYTDNENDEYPLINEIVNKVYEY
jgi:hypothetical protein